MFNVTKGVESADRTTCHNSLFSPFNKFMRSGFVHEMNVPNRTFNPKRRGKKGKQNQSRQRWINYRAGDGRLSGDLENQTRTVSLFGSRRASRFEVKQDQHNSGMDARGACSFSSVNVQVERTGSWMSHERPHFPKTRPSSAMSILKNKIQFGVGPRLKTTVLLRRGSPMRTGLVGSTATFSS